MSAYYRKPKSAEKRAKIREKMCMRVRHQWKQIHASSIIECELCHQRDHIVGPYRERNLNLLLCHIGQMKYILES